MRVSVTQAVKDGFRQERWLEVTLTVLSSDYRQTAVALSDTSVGDVAADDDGVVSFHYLSCNEGLS